MNELEMKEMFRQTTYDPVKYPDVVIEQLAKSGYPAAKVIMDINALLRGSYVDILSSLMSALSDVNHENENFYFQCIWRYYSGKEAGHSFDNDPWVFIGNLAHAFDSGSDGFPVNKRAATILYQNGSKLF